MCFNSEQIYRDKWSYSLTPGHKWLRGATAQKHKKIRGLPVASGEINDGVHSQQVTDLILISVIEGRLGK